MGHGELNPTRLNLDSAEVVSKWLALDQVILKSYSGQQYALAVGFTVDCSLPTVISRKVRSEESDRCSAGGSD